MPRQKLLQVVQGIARRTATGSDGIDIGRRGKFRIADKLLDRPGNIAKIDRKYKTDDTVPDERTRTMLRQVGNMHSRIPCRRSQLPGDAKGISGPCKIKDHKSHPNI